MNLLLRYLRPHRTAVIGALACCAGNQLLLLMDPLIVRRIIDRYAVNFAGRERQWLINVGFLLAAGIVATFMAWVAKSYQIEFVHRVARRVSLQIYGDGVRNSLNMSFSESGEHRSGEIASRLQAARNDVDRFLTAFVNSAFAPLVSVVFLIFYVSRIHWILVPTYLIAIPGVVAATFMLSRRVLDIQQSIATESARLSGSATELFRNLEFIRGLGLANHGSDRVKADGHRLFELELKKHRAIRRLSFFHGAGVNAVRFAIVALLLYLVSLRQITMGQFFSLFLYLYMLLNPIQEMGEMLNLYRETEGTLEGVRFLLEKPGAEPVRISPGTDTEPIEGIAFHRVCFRYPGSEKPTLDEISFSAERGAVVAIVGKSGAGKTTIVKLLLGILEPDSGSIVMNGNVLGKSQMQMMRERTGLVTQETQLFSGSIRDNLIFVQPEATDAECVDALEQAAATGLLSRATRGLDTPIGEGGMKLSGGERQRLAIARALLRKPQLLIFDEATSALDLLTEAEIAATLRSIHERRNMITIVITHRLSTIRAADRIFVVDQGRVVDSGDHDLLLSRAGLFRNLWTQQNHSRASAT